MNEETLFAEALAMPSPRARREFLDQACGRDADLRARVEVLLAAHERAGAFLESPPVDLRAPGGAGAPLTGAATAAAAEPVDGPGARVGPYRLLEQIGEGGMGVVFMAEQTRPVRRRVALKIIKPGMDTRQVIARFEAERQALAMMDHPNIAKVLEAGATDAGQPYFVMELVRGVPITEYCDEHKLPPRQRLELFVQVCQAVQHAHQKGIIHRDLKPSNVLVTHDDADRPTPKVIDFGIAKATGGERLSEHTLFTEHCQLVGTPLYTSPEQAEMRAVADVDTRSDVYSLGVLLYELLTGTTPFGRDRLVSAAMDEVRRIICEEDPPRPSTRLSTLGDTLATVSASRGIEPRRLGQMMRGELDLIVMKCLEKERVRRYDTASALAADVGRYLADEPVEASPASAAYRLRKFARRNKGVLAAATSVAMILIAASVVSTWQAVRATRAKAAAVSAELRASRERDHVLAQQQQIVAEGKRADSQAAIAAALTRFLQEDVLGQASPRGQFNRQFQPKQDLTVREALDRAAQRIAGRFNGQPGVEARIRFTIANAYQNLSANDKAEVQALVSRRLMGEAGEFDNKEVVSEFLSGIYLQTGERDKAVRLFREDYEAARLQLGEDHDLVWKLRMMIGCAYRVQNGSERYDPQNLVSYFEPLIADLRRLRGPNHPLVGAADVQLAAAYWDLHRYDDARRLFAEARAIFGPRTDTDYADDHCNATYGLAQFYVHQKNFAEAESVYRETEAAARGGRSVYWLPVANLNLAGVQFELGKFNEAAPRFDQAAGLMLTAPEKRTLGTDVGTVLAYAIACNRLAGNEQAAERWEGELRKLLLKSDLDQTEKAIGTQGATAKNLKERAKAYRRVGRFDEALADIARAAALDPSDRDAWEDLANLQLYLGQEQAYRETRRQLIERFKNSRSGDHPAKTCLLLPLPRRDADVVNGMADGALASKPKEYILNYFRCTKGMAEYRRGNFESAIHWLASSREGFSKVMADQGRRARLRYFYDEVRSTDDFFTAMAQYQLGRKAEARATLALARHELRFDVPAVTSGNAKVPCFDWMMVQIVAREAEEMIAGEGPTTTPAATLPATRPTTMPTVTAP